MPTFTCLNWSPLQNYSGICFASEHWQWIVVAKRRQEQNMIPKHSWWGIMLKVFFDYQLGCTCDRCMVITMPHCTQSNCINNLRPAVNKLQSSAFQALWCPIHQKWCIIKELALQVMRGLHPIHIIPCHTEMAYVAWLGRWGHISARSTAINLHASSLGGSAHDCSHNAYLRKQARGCVCCLYFAATVKCRTFCLFFFSVRDFAQKYLYSQWIGMMSAKKK